jgi:hypothetical protein
MTQTAQSTAEQPLPSAGRWLGALVFLTLLLPACSTEQISESPTGGLVAQDAAKQQRLDGDWVVREYAEALVRTRDPQQALAAVNASEPILLRISQSDEGEAWLAVLNFHEGVRALVESRDSLAGGGWNEVRFSRPFDWPLLAGDHAVKKDPEGMLSWRVEADAEAVEWVLQRTEPSVERWASVVVLGGSYTDGAGQPVHFAGDGLVVWKGTAHRYRASLDMVGVDCPYLELVNEGEGERRRLIFGFRREDERLLLFDAGSASEPVISCQGPPLLVLTPR